MTGRFARLNVGLYFRPGETSFDSLLNRSFIPFASRILHFWMLRFSHIEYPSMEYVRKGKRNYATILAPFPFHLASRTLSISRGIFYRWSQTDDISTNAAFQSPPYRDGSRAQTRSGKSINCRELALSL